MKKFLFFVAMMAASAFLFTACNEEKADTQKDSIMTAEDLTALEEILLDVEDEIEELIGNGAMSDEEVQVRSGQCPTRTVTPADGTFPKTITLDYGSGCTSPRGREKSGKIIITQSAPLNQVGATRTITFQNYKVDGALIEGNTTITTNGNRSYTRRFDHKITYPDGDTANWKGEHTYELIAGANTPRVADDVIRITGSVSGVNRDGKTYNSEITEPLIKARICPWIGKGIRQVNRNGNVFTIDYGFGDRECDNKAEVTLPNGETRIVRMEPRWRR